MEETPTDRQTRILGHLLRVLLIGVWLLCASVMCWFAYSITCGTPERLDNLERRVKTLEGK